MLSPLGKVALAALSVRVAAAGEPFKLFFKPAGLEAELHAAGFARVELTGSKQLNQLYFQNRQDGLKLPEPGLGMMATAWV
jgi:hypothetical protein